MIDWKPIKDAVRSLVVDLTGLPAPAVRFRDEAEGSVWTQFPSLWLMIAPLGEYGYQEERRDQPTATDDAIVTCVEQKGFRLSIRCESDSQNIDDGNRHAAVILDTLKTRLKRSSSRARITDLFAIAKYQPLKAADYVDQDQRKLNVRVLDILCSTVDNDLDTTQGAGGWINEAQITGTINDAGATPQTVAIDSKGS